METNYNDLIDLAHIPEINREFAALFENWEKKPAVSAINFELKKQWKYYYDTLFVSQLPHLKTEKVFFRWFKLIKKDNWQWGLTFVPPIPNELLTDMLLPQELITRMTDTLVNPDRVVTIKGKRNQFANLAVDLQFVHFSSTYIFGTFKTYFNRALSESSPLSHYTHKKLPATNTILETLKFILAVKDIIPQEIDQWLKEYLTTVPPLRLERHKRKSDHHRVKISLQDNPNRPGGDFKNSPPNRGEEFPQYVVAQLMMMSLMPGLNERLLLKWYELQEGYHKKTIEAYKFHKERLYQYLFTDRRLNRNMLKDSPPLYWFQLTAMTPNVWVITNLDPEPPVYEPVDDILPGEFLELVQHAEPDGKVIKGIYEFEEPSWRKLDIWWVRYSPNCVMGSVCEYTDDLDQLQAGYEALLKGSDIDSGQLYRLFVYHLRSHLEL